MMQTFNNTISVADPVEGPGGPGHPLFFDQNEAPRAEKSLWRTGPPPLSQGLYDRPPPLPSGSATAYTDEMHSLTPKISGSGNISHCQQQSYSALHSPGGRGGGGRGKATQQNFIREAPPRGPTLSL